MDQTYIRIFRPKGAAGDELHILGDWSGAAGDEVHILADWSGAGGDRYMVTGVSAGDVILIAI